MKEIVSWILAIGISTYTLQVRAADTFGFDMYYDAATAGAVSTGSDVAITRQSSCSVQLKNFAFSEVQSGNFVPQLTISFRTGLPSGGSDETSRITVLFEDVIKGIGKNGVNTLRLSNQALATNVNLSRVTSARVELRLHRVKDSFKDFAEVIRPLLNSVQGTQVAFGIFENLLAKTQDGTDAPLLFSGDFLVAGNMFEYQRLSSAFSDAFLKGNQEYLILADNEIPLQDTSLKGKVISLVNAGSKAILGSQVIDPASSNIKGYATLVFTKFRIPLLPMDLEDDLREVERQLSRAQFDANRFDVVASRAETTTAYLESTKSLDSRSASTLVEFLSLARVYGEFRRNSKDTTPWDAQFSDWLFGFKIRSATLAAQAVGVRNLYPSISGTHYIAPLYLPYFLPDDLLASFQSWQMLMHRALAKNKSTVAAVQGSAT